MDKDWITHSFKLKSFYTFNSQNCHGPIFKSKWKKELIDTDADTKNWLIILTDDYFILT